MILRDLHIGKKRSRPSGRLLPRRLGWDGSSRYAVPRRVGGERSWGESARDCQRPVLHRLLRNSELLPVRNGRLSTKCKPATLTYSAFAARHADCWTRELELFPGDATSLSTPGSPPDHSSEGRAAPRQTRATGPAFLAGSPQGRSALKGNFYVEPIHLGLNCEISDGFGSAPNKVIAIPANIQSLPQRLETRNI